MKRYVVLVLLAAAGVAHAVDSHAAGDPKKLVCKRQSVTGSLVQAVRVCHTPAEWEIIIEQNRDEGRRVQEQSFRQGGRGG